MRHLAEALACLVVFHAPDGSLVSVEKAHISALRPVSEAVKEHLAPGTKTLVYVGQHKFGITESLDEAETMLEQCDQ